MAAAAGAGASPTTPKPKKQGGSFLLARPPASECHHVNTSPRSSGFRVRNPFVIALHCPCVCLVVSADAAVCLRCLACLAAAEASDAGVSLLLPMQLSAQPDYKELGREGSGGTRARICPRYADLNSTPDSFAFTSPPAFGYPTSAGDVDASRQRAKARSGGSVRSCAISAVLPCRADH